MKPEFLNLTNLKYVLRGLPLPVSPVAKLLEMYFQKLDKENGIPSDIVKWNIQFSNHVELNPMEAAGLIGAFSPQKIRGSRENLADRFDEVFCGDRYTQEEKQNCANAIMDYGEWENRICEKEVLGKRGLIFQVRHDTTSDYLRITEQSKNRYGPEKFYTSSLQSQIPLDTTQPTVVTCSLMMADDAVDHASLSAQDSYFLNTVSPTRSIKNLSPAFSRAEGTERRLLVFFNIELCLSADPNEEEYTVPMCFEVPLHVLLRGSRDLNRTYTVYSHSLETDRGEDFVYYGLTIRGWQLRFMEHWKEQDHRTRRSLPLKMRSLARSALAEKRGLPDIKPKISGVYSTLCANGMTQKVAMDLEEYLVDKYSLEATHTNGLNMIPGGYAGIRALHKLRGKNGAPLVSENQKNQFMSTEQREKILDGYLLQNPRVGVPNPGAAEKWKDDAYAEAVICGREERLDPEQVRAIRYLSATGLETDVILQKVAALNLRQVEGVLSGKHYSRIT